MNPSILTGRFMTDLNSNMIILKFIALTSCSVIVVLFKFQYDNT